jgi:hypothetical protein
MKVHFPWFVLAAAVMLPLPISNAQIMQQSPQPGEARESLGDLENVDRDATAHPAVFTQRFRGEPFKNVTLEMSLKPFKKNDPDYIRSVCREVFTQWAALIRHADQVSVMLWTADGSEILDYRGDPDQRLEWAMYLGNPNTEHPVGSQPDAPLSIHQRAFLYMDNPPEFTFGDLRFIVQCLKDEGRRVTGKPVRVGATFDPGPEFAKSPFKYERHPEICMGATMGHKSFVCCYAVLSGDDRAIRRIPGRHPRRHAAGHFFGRQTQHF